MKNINYVLITASCTVFLYMLQWNHLINLGPLFRFIYYQISEVYTEPYNSNYYNGDNVS